MVNVLKIRTLYSILFFSGQNFGFMKILSEMANSTDPDQIAPEGAI